jgi:hypothetical protein
MKLRCMTKTGQGWQKETPDDVSRWMWRHDGMESVCVDETNPAAKVYYCGIPSMLTTYREAWEREGKREDRRRAAEFITLDKLLFEREAV